MAGARVYAPWLMLPVTGLIGFAGYQIEWMIRKEKNTPYRVNSTMEDRNERKLQEASEVDPTKVNSLKGKKDHPTTILGRNDFSSTKAE